MEKKDSGVQNTSPVLKQSSRLKDLQDDHKKAKSLRNKEKKQKQDKDKNCLNTQKDYNPLKLTNKNYKTLDTYKNCAGVDMWYPTQSLHKHTIPLEHPEVLLERQKKNKEKRERSQKPCSKKNKTEKKNRSRSKSKDNKKKSKKEKSRKVDSVDFKKMEFRKNDIIKKRPN